MISKRIAGRKDGKSSAVASLRYGEGLTPDRETGELLDKSHRTRLGNFGLVDDGVYIDAEEMSELIDLAGTEMQSNCDMNTRVGADKKLGHFVVSYNQDKPSEAVLRDTEDSMLAALKLDNNHFATFLHNDNGYWHLHIFACRIEKEKLHRGNPLWQDKTIRDKVCREIEIRHGLTHDNGLHDIKDGQIVEVPFAERIARREAKAISITDKARTTEIYSGEKTFQTWCIEIRIGDRLKHSKSWQDLHATAAAYSCEVRQRGAGFVICPVGQKGGIQLSKMGLKNLPAKFGAFEAAKPEHQAVHGEATYKPSPANEKAASHYDRWRVAKDAFKPIQTAQINEQREAHKKIRSDLRVTQKAELEKIRSQTIGQERFAAVSVAKMQHTFEHAAITEQFARERQSFRNRLTDQGPGNTFRAYLVIEAGKGDNVALELSRKYGADEATDVLRQREADKLRVAATVTGQEYKPAQRMPFKHRVKFSGSVVFDLGMGRTITDSRVSKQIQLNAAAAVSPEAIVTALRFATSKFGSTLTLTGSEEFQRRAVEISVRNGLNINFNDTALEAYKQELATSLTQEKNHHVTRTQSHSTSRFPPAHRRDRLRKLSEFNLAPEPKQPEMLLPKDVSSGVADRNEEGRNGSGLRRVNARSGRAIGPELSGTSLGTDHDIRSGQGVRPPVKPARDEIGSNQRVHLPVANSSSATRSGLSRVEGAAVAEVPVVLHQPVDVEIPSRSAVEWAKAEGVELGDVLTNCIGKVEFVFGNMAIIKSGRSKSFEYKIADGLSIVKGQHIAIDKNGSLSVMEKTEIDKSR